MCNYPDYKSVKTKDLTGNTILVEVFKTDISNRLQADRLINEIQNKFTGYQANVDLWDCDNILRIQSATGSIQSPDLIHFLKERGCTAEVLV